MGTEMIVEINMFINSVLKEWETSYFIRYINQLQTDQKIRPNKNWMNNFLRTEKLS